MSSISSKIESILRLKIEVHQDSHKKTFTLQELVNAITEVGKVYFQGGVLLHLLENKSYNDIDLYLECNKTTDYEIERIVTPFLPVELYDFKKKYRDDEIALYNLGIVDLCFKARGSEVRAFVALEDLLLCDLKGTLSLKEAAQKLPTSPSVLELQEGLSKGCWRVPNPEKVRNFAAIVPKRMVDPTRIIDDFEEIKKAVNANKEVLTSKPFKAMIESRKGSKLWRACYLLNLKYLLSPENQKALNPLLLEIEDPSDEWLKSYKARFLLKKESNIEFLEFFLIDEDGGELRFWARCEDSTLTNSPSRRHQKNLIKGSFREQAEAAFFFGKAAFEVFIKNSRSLKERPEFFFKLTSELQEKVIECLQALGDNSLIARIIDDFKKENRRVSQNISHLILYLTGTRAEKLEAAIHLGKKYLEKTIEEDRKFPTAEQKNIIHKFYDSLSDDLKQLLINKISAENLITIFKSRTKHPNEIARKILNEAPSKGLLLALNSDLSQDELQPHFEKKIHALSVEELQAFFTRFNAFPTTFEDRAYELRDQLVKFAKLLSDKGASSKWIPWLFETNSPEREDILKIKELVFSNFSTTKGMLNALVIWRKKFKKEDLFIEFMNFFINNDSHFNSNEKSIIACNLIESIETEILSVTRIDEIIFVKEKIQTFIGFIHSEAYCKVVLDFKIKSSTMVSFILKSNDLNLHIKSKNFHLSKKAFDDLEVILFSNLRKFVIDNGDPSMFLFTYFELCGLFAFEFKDKGFTIHPKIKNVLCVLKEKKAKGMLNSPSIGMFREMPALIQSLYTHQAVLNINGFEMLELLNFIINSMVNEENNLDNFFLGNEGGCRIINTKQDAIINIMILGIPVIYKETAIPASGFEKEARLFFENFIEFLEYIKTKEKDLDLDSKTKIFKSALNLSRLLILSEKNEPIVFLLFENAHLLDLANECIDAGGCNPSMCQDMDALLKDIKQPSPSLLRLQRNANALLAIKTQDK